MSFIVTPVLLLWPVCVFVLFACVDARKAVAWGFTLSWCFLPVAGLALPGIPDYTKTTATVLAVLLCTLFFKLDLVINFRPRWVDLPALTWCLCPLLSSLTNGLGLYDGASGVFSAFLIWGAPYLIGRIYFTRLVHLPDLVLPIIGCAILYVPLCLYEVRLSPQLHNILYGFHQHSFAQTLRGGGFRPMVFMNHGLQLAMWLGVAFLLSFTWWKFAGNRSLPVFGSRFRTWGACLLLLGTLVLAKSLGALLLIVMATLLMAIYHYSATRWLAFAVPMICTAYLAIRSTGVSDLHWLTDIAAVASEDRAGSLLFRLDNENMLAEKARKRPLTGWGGWGRARIYDEDGRDISVTDGTWIIAFGNNGTIGLVSLYSLLLIGPTTMLYRSQPGLWALDSNLALAGGLAIASQASAIDSLPNAMQLPVMTVALGALSGIAAKSHRQKGIIQDRNSQRTNKADTPPKRPYLWRP